MTKKLIRAWAVVSESDGKICFSSENRFLAIMQFVHLSISSTEVKYQFIELRQVGKKNNKKKGKR